MLAYADNLYVNGEIIRNLIIPDGTEKIEDYAFGKKSFKCCYIPESVEYVGTDSFYGIRGVNGISAPFYEGTEQMWDEIVGDRYIFEYDHFHAPDDFFEVG